MELDIITAHGMVLIIIQDQSHGGLVYIIVPTAAGVSQLELVLAGWVGVSILMEWDTGVQEVTIEDTAMVIITVTGMVPEQGIALATQPDQETQIAMYITIVVPGSNNPTGHAQQIM